MKLKKLIKEIKWQSSILFSVLLFALLLLTSIIGDFFSEQVFHIILIATIILFILFILLDLIKLKETKKDKHDN